MQIFPRFTLERFLNPTLSLSKLLENVREILTESSTSSSHNNISTQTDMATQTPDRCDIFCMVVGVIRHKEILNESTSDDILQGTSTSTSSSSSTLIGN
jgi:hypothetical protein